MNKQIQTEADELGFFGEYGGQYVPETLMPAVIELKKLIKRQKQTQSFKENWNTIYQSMWDARHHLHMLHHILKA